MVVSVNEFGLANRIKSWMAALYRDKDCRVYWPVDKACHCTFGKLFSNKCEVKSVPVGADTVSSPFIFGHRGEVDFRYHDTPMDVIEKYKFLLGQIEFAPKIWRHIKGYLREFTEDTISMAVRTWRNEPPPRNLKWPFNEKLYFEYVNQLYKVYEKCYFTCDDPALFNKMKEIYGDWIFYAQRRGPIGSWYDENSCMDALCDMYLIGQAPLMFVVHRSTFSELGWWFGKCKPGVIRMPKEIWRDSV